MFEINHSCSNNFVFTIRKITIVMIVDIHGLCLQKKMLISLYQHYRVAKKGVGVVYQLYNFILKTTITQNNFKSTNICQSAY